MKGVGDRVLACQPGRGKKTGEEMKVRDNPVAVLGKNIWGSWPLIILEATTAKRNLL